MELNSILNPSLSRNNSFNNLFIIKSSYKKNNVSFLKQHSTEDLEKLASTLSNFKNPNIMCVDRLVNVVEQQKPNTFEFEIKHHTKIAHGGQTNGKKPRKSYEVYKKLEILDEKNKHGMNFVVEKYHISRSIISRWLSNIEKYKTFNKKNLKKLHKGPKASFSMEQENMIIEKINQCRQVGEQVSGETIKKFALELSKQLNNTTFKASSGWLENFKNRHSLQLK
ncbi:hypothetical protein CYY_003216 [Polysphondylium violaceum]|uniref:HTH CENPB-type domain-containing protein n=1 Tax=Polysphondylium violaceum TaxID=133409 RepID=A0A8J4V0C6_9MYCE|nr:hypothetical protein CYY_003216 [Polysphondylium violaceum]